MLLLVKELKADRVLLGVEESKHETMLQMLSPGDTNWRNVRTVMHGCEMPLSVRGVQYMFRLADETGQMAFPETSVKVLTPPAPPALLGIGRNVCIFWDSSVPRGMPTEVAASVIEHSGLLYVVSWRREYGRVGTVSRSRQLSCAVVGGAEILGSIPQELEGSVELRRQDLTSINGSLVLLCAFPQFQKDTDYRITLRTVSSGEDSEGNVEEVLQSAESSAVHWSTGLNPPTPLTRVAASNEMTLKLPVEVDACGVLTMFKIRALRYVEGQEEGNDAFRRLEKRIGGASLPAGNTISLLGIPADARCGIRMCCAIDLRLLGAEQFFWDTTAILEVETVPNPPTFCGMALEEEIQQPSLVVSWLPRTIGTHFREPPEPAAYQIQVYSHRTGTYITVASTFNLNVELCSLDWHNEARSMAESRELPNLEPGVCVCVRLLRAPSNPASLSLPAHQAAAVVVLAPLPPVVTLQPTFTEDLVRVSWDGSLDVTHLPATVSPLPFSFVLEAASGPALPRVRTKQEFTHRSEVRVQIRFGKIPGNPFDVRRTTNSQHKPGRPPAIGAFQTIATSRGASVITASLAPGLCYHFRLRLITIYGVATSSPVEVRTKPKVPSAPLTLRGTTAYFISAASHRAPYLRLAWDEPLSNGMPVDRYLVQVRYSAANPGTWGVWRSMYTGLQVSCGDDATLNQHSVVAQYRVKAGSVLGWSSYSRILTVRAPKGLKTWRSEYDLNTADEYNPGVYPKSNDASMHNIDGLTIALECPHDTLIPSVTTQIQVKNKRSTDVEIANTARDCIATGVLWRSEHRGSDGLDNLIDIANPSRSQVVEDKIINHVEATLGYPVATSVLRMALSELQDLRGALSEMTPVAQ